MTFPEKLEITPLEKPPDATVSVKPPGSKSITNRALVLAALAGRGRGCELRNVLRSEDTEVMIEALRRLGFQVELHPSDPPVTLELRLRDDWRPFWNATIGSPGQAEVIPATQADLFVGNSGTTMRFLTALVSIGRGRYRLDGIARMRERPIEDLLGALRQLGVKAVSEQNNGCPPVVIETTGLNGGEVRIKGDVSSQFLSGLLMAAPLARGHVTIHVEGTLVSEPYIGMTTALMTQFGVRVGRVGDRCFHVPGRQEYRPPHTSQYVAHPWFTIEPDASAAS